MKRTWFAISLALTAIGVPRSEAQDNFPKFNNDRHAVSIPIRTVTKQAPVQVDRGMEASTVMLSSLRAEDVRSALRSTPDRPGIGRAIAKESKNLGVWDKNAAGHDFWRIRIASPGAVAMRVHFGQAHLGEGALWVRGVGAAKGPALGPYQQSGSFGDGDIWTGAVPGDSVEIIYQPETSKQVLPFEIAEAYHFWRFLGKKADTRAHPEFVDTSCFQDVSCYTGYPPVMHEAASTVMLLFQDHECSGTLLNDKASDFAPYILTAGHCVSSQNDARSVLAIFNFRTSYCGDLSNLSPYNFQQVSGASLLSASNQGAGLLDYALLFLSPMSGIGSVSYAGWTGDLNPGAHVFSVSHPRNLPQRFAEGFDTGNDDGNHYTIQFLNGLTDHGSSGSGIFVNDDQLVGLASAGANGEDVSACSLPAPVSGLFTRFDAIYPNIQSYLQAGPPPTPPTPVTGVTLTADPNPITLAPGQFSGMTRLTWNNPSGSATVIMVNAPNGAQMTGYLGASGSIETGTWVSNGMTFYLVDVATGTSLAQVTIQTQVSTTASFMADPNPIVLDPGAQSGHTTLYWNAPGHSRLIIRVLSPSGPAMTGTLGQNGNSTTGDWVSDGMTFYLMDLDTGETVATTVVSAH